jgi:ubiquinone/menaquinone biosynthesis C-methylase UbiE
VKKETAQKLLRLSKKEYNVFASEFSATRPFFWRELEYLKKYVFRGDSVLDIGCGNGRLVDLLGDTDIEYTGVDFSKELIAIAQSTRGTKGTFLKADALALPFEDSSFDVVYSVAVLHHIPSQENRKQFVREAFRVLKPGGVCVFTVWNIAQVKFLKTHILHGLKKIAGISELDFGDVIISFGKQKRQRYVHTFTKRSLQHLFGENGFSNISVQEVERKSGYANLVITAIKSD